MKIRAYDDLHCEFNQYEFEPLPNDDQTVCILAGDIGQGERPSTWMPTILRASKRFEHVIYVLGNHEYYFGEYPTTIQNMRNEIAKHNLTNVHLLENQFIEIDGVSFIGATLWTDFNRGNPVDMHMANHGLSDYRLIKVAKEGEHVIKGPYTRNIIPSDIIVLHNTSKAYIIKTTLEQKSKGNKIVLVVHHGVTNRSLNPFYENDPLNPAFCSELSEELLQIEPDLIIHGHVHYARDYYVDEDNKIPEIFEDNNKVELILNSVKS